jgi:hypothetical protein
MLVLQSPMRHSPKAMVLLVPSLMALMGRAVEVLIVPPFGATPIAMIAKIPGGSAAYHGQALAPTDPK